MTTVCLKLVGSNNDKTITFKKDSITILDIFTYLMEHNLLFNEISKIMFINKGNNITNDTLATYYGTDENPLIIHIFINDIDIKNEILREIFNDSPIDINQMDSNDKEIKISQEDINKNNSDIIKLFSDKDFTFLLNICLNRPELFNTVSSYIINGNITNEIININDDDFKYKDEFEQLLELLKQLNINVENEKELKIKSIIQHFNGHLNLSLRYILHMG